MFRGNYYGRKPIMRNKVELRVGKLRNERPQVRMRSLEIIKGGDDMIVE